MPSNANNDRSNIYGYPSWEALSTTLVAHLFSPPAEGPEVLGPVGSRAT